MNEFFSFDFHISEIVLCTRVPPGKGARVHRNRPNHGLVLEGNGTKRYQFIGGETFFTEPHMVHYLPKFSNYDVDFVDPGDCIAINFDLAEQEITFPRFSLPGENYGGMFQQALNLWTLRTAGYRNACMSALYGIIYQLQLDARKKYLSPAQGAIAETGRELIVRGFSDPSLTVGEIAATLGVSPEYFRRLFGEKYHSSPRAFIIQLRIARAKELILSGEFRVGEIAEMCGFTSNTYFCSEFKCATGITPSEYGRLGRMDEWKDE